MLSQISVQTAHGFYSRFVEFRHLSTAGPLPVPGPKPLWGLGSMLYGGRFTPKGGFRNGLSGRRSSYSDGRSQRCFFLATGSDASHGATAVGADNRGGHYSPSSRRDCFRRSVGVGDEPAGTNGRLAPHSGNGAGGSDANPWTSLPPERPFRGHSVSIQQKHCERGLRRSFHESTAGALIDQSLRSPRTAGTAMAITWLDRWAKVLASSPHLPFPCSLRRPARSNVG